MEGSDIAVQDQKPVVERRRSRLPQPDFTHYKKANAYPGPDYFFVGHSYHVDSAARDEAREIKRAQAIKALFQASNWLTVPALMGNPDAVDALSRCERDLLNHLPENALVGPAIDGQGQVIDQSFTIWRKEMRRQQVS